MDKEKGEREIVAKFVGGYAEQVQRLALAALVAGQHAHFVGAPGTGKTTILLAVLRAVYGDGAFGFLGVNPATRGEAVEGPYKIDMLINESRLERNVADSLYNPCYKALLIDEFSRANDVVLNQMIQLLDRRAAPALTVPVLATANFMVKDSKFEAVYDRLALWGWVNPNHINIGSVIAAQLNSLGSGGVLDAPLPTPSVDDIAVARSTTPGPKAIKAIVKITEQVADEAEQAGMGQGINHRRISQWASLLYYNGALHSGTNDFGTVPDEAVRALQWAYPLKTPEMAAEWATITNSVGDPIGAAIDAMLGDIVEKMNANVALEFQTRNAKLGQVVADATKTLDTLNAHGDERIEETKEMIMKWFTQAVTGKAISR